MFTKPKYPAFNHQHGIDGILMKPWSPRLRPSGSVYLRLLNLKWGARSCFMGHMRQMGHMAFEQA
jgi:hypothetical protein